MDIWTRKNIETKFKVKKDMKKMSNILKTSVMVPRWSRLRSRIDSIQPAYTLLALLMVVLFGVNEKAWGATVTFNATNSSFSESAPYIITQDSVDFKLYIPNWYNSGNGHFYVYTANNDAYVKWTPNGNFSIAVTGISFDGQNATHKGGFLNSKTYTGKSYLKSYSFANSSYNTFDNIGQNSSTYTKAFTTADNTKIFPGGAALGNKDYFNVYARNNDDGQEGADSNKDEYQINSVTLTYTVTPPAPTLKNGSSVTRSQFVEGRSNNTVTLIDYFKPFNSGVSMSYVVKKKNGSGVYETINSGYTITSNVFKTTVVGEYQIFANSNATGAFNASSSSSALAVTIEEVRPITISVGSQELYVGGATSMTITEQLNTTNDVVFEYDENFFDYNESTHVLTAKNDANASFSSIEKSIRVTQEAAGVYAAVDMTINFTIKKNVPTFTWNTREHYYYNETISHFFKSSNTATAISVTSTDAHKQIATVVDSALVIYNKPGTARVTMTQAENYYWAEHTEYRDVTPEWKSNHVTLDVTESNYTSVIENHYSGSSDRFRWLNGGVLLGSKDVSLSEAEGWDSRYIDIHFTGMPESLSFTYERSVSTATGMDWWVKEKTEDGEWGEETIYHPSGNPASGSCNVPLRQDTRWVRLRCYCNYGAYFKNIKITKKEYFKTDKASLDFGVNQINATPDAKTFKFYHASAGYITSITSSDNTHFTVSPSSVTTGGEVCDSAVISVTYHPEDEGEHSGTITISDNIGNTTSVIVTGETQGKLATHLVYIGKASYPVDTTNIPVSELFEVRDANNNLVAGATITLGTGDPGKAVIEGTPNAVDPICSGLVNIAASYAGDGVTYAAATNTGISMPITFNAVDDEVSIDTHGHSVLVVGDTLDLTGWGSALSNSAITFTSGNSSYFKVQDGKLIALAKGEANLTATSAGNCVYNSGSTYTSIKVRNANDPCSTLSLNKTGKITIKDGKSTTYNDITEGVYDKLEFKVWKQTLAASSNKTRVTLIGEADAELYSYEISADSLDNSENNAKTVVVNLANYQTLKKVQFTGNGSLYSQYFKDVKITQQAYLRANAGSGTLAANANVSMPKVKACEESSKDITISYSDISRIQLSHTNDAFTYEVYKGGNLIEDFDNDCGGYGEFTLRCKCTPTAKGNYSDVVTLSASGKSQTITLNGTANAPDRTIVWDIPTANTISATQSVDLTAYAETSCLSPAGGVYYTYSSVTEGAATIDGDLITFNKAATVTVTAHTVPHDNYNDALAVDKVWTVGKVGTQMRTLPTITSTITYGDNASVVAYDNESWKAEDVLNHNEVEGYINYVGPAEFTAAGSQNLIFNFTPKIVGTYDVCQFTVPVTVQQKASIATPVAANITYGQRVNESVLTSGDGSTTAGTWTWKDEAANTQVLAAREEPYTGLHVIFTPDNNNYTTLEATVSLKVDEAPTDVFTNAAGDNNWDNPDNWSSGVVPADLEPDIVVEGDLKITEDRTVGKLTIENTGSVSVITGGTLTVNGASDPRTEYGDVHVLNDGAISLGNSADLQVRHFTIDAKLGGYVSENVREESASGQVDNPSKLNINGDAYFKLALDPEGAITYGWYDFVVPFEVNIVGGIFLPSNLATPLTNGYDFAVMSFDEAKRAVKGKEWNKYSGTMQPGRVYTITVDYRHGWNEIVFKKKEGASISGSTSFTPSYSSTLGEAVDRGWNGFGNGTLFHTELKDVSASTLVHVYDHANKCYHSHEAKDYTIAVGTSFFMQVEGNTPIEFKAADNDNSGFMAPARNRSSVERFSLSLMNDADMVYDHLWVGANEDATEEYVIGEDVLKMGTMNESKIARMWTSKGGHDLCAVNATLSNEQAIIPLSLFAPQDAAYVLAVDAAPADANLYLTYEGNVIWDLTMSPFEIELTKGTTYGYGLLMEAKDPAVTTGIEETENAGQTMRKVIINNTVYIITPEGKMYDIIGKGVKF